MPYLETINHLTVTSRIKKKESRCGFLLSEQILLKIADCRVYVLCVGSVCLFL